MPSRRCSISYYHYTTILFTYKACIEKVYNAVGTALIGGMNYEKGNNE